MDITAVRAKVRPLWFRGTEEAKAFVQLIIAVPENKPRRAKSSHQYSAVIPFKKQVMIAQGMAPRANQGNFCRKK